jgi:hypothetical protein
MGQLEEQGAFVSARLQEGATRRDVVRELCSRFGLNARAAWRVLCGWSQRQAADEWNARWPDDPKDNKRFSYWERWPLAGNAPSLEVLNRLAQLYRCHVSDLLYGYGEHGDSSRADDGLTAPAVSGTEAPDGWYCESFRAIVNTYSEPVEVVEQRVIVAAVDSLTLIPTGVSIPRHVDDALATHGVEPDLLYGGELNATSQISESRFQHVIRPARPIRLGERHEYGLRLRLPARQLLSPHYVYVPKCRCDSFELIVRFDPISQPRGLYLLNGAPVPVIYEEIPSGETLRPDGTGEVKLTFENLRIGLGYGVRWIF